MSRNYYFFDKVNYKLEEKLSILELEDGDKEEEKASLLKLESTCKVEDNPSSLDQKNLAHDSHLEQTFAEYNAQVNHDVLARLDQRAGEIIDQLKDLTDALNFMGYDEVLGIYPNDANENKEVQQLVSRRDLLGDEMNRITAHILARKDKDIGQYPSLHSFAQLQEEHRQLVYRGW
ncbi:hypothetical protein CONPUDRAFT_159010 [Coniophora puteana RWD-64-598 SS2]|uniref:Uncharacterized protein n=1 Tax=Coniophora puteana (strain RWD-64-598) TaxID=741705 RepID=A0A5M3M8N7_CONPW|nr:uncharacterized protein CONPUDRAFT_159010 [Coniophora puteana RWD-64-598 SS2]EIW75559.1 hypothetical protein CONPUDRAFT_159010 [Coniophora puteana RWD-64-598 SS2]